MARSPPSRPHSQDKSLLGAFLFLLMGNSSILSSPSSDTYSYSSRTGWGLSSLKLCTAPNTPGLGCGLRALELGRHEQVVQCPPCSSLGLRGPAAGHTRAAPSQTRGSSEDGAWPTRCMPGPSSGCLRACSSRPPTLGCGTSSASHGASTNSRGSLQSYFGKTNSAILQLGPPQGETGLQPCPATGTAGRGRALSAPNGTVPTPRRQGALGCG